MDLNPPPPVLAVGVPTVLPLPISGSGDSSGMPACEAMCIQMHVEEYLGFTRW